MELAVVSPSPSSSLLPSIPGLPGPTSRGIGSLAVPAPPKPGSLAAKADLEAVRMAQRAHTPEGDAWARRLAHDGTGAIWFELAKRHRAETGKLQGWLGTALLAATLAANTAATQAIKWRYRRERPFQVDPSIVPVVPKPFDPSYPSGHSSAAFAAARVIAALEPSLAVEAYSLAGQVAASRVYAGVHFPSDVVVGALLGTGVAEKLLQRIAPRARA